MANRARAIIFRPVRRPQKRKNNEEEETRAELKCCALFDDNCSIENLSFRTFSSALMACLQIFLFLQRFKCRMAKCENYWCWSFAFYFGLGDVHAGRYESVFSDYPQSWFLNRKLFMHAYGAVLVVCVKFMELCRWPTSADNQKFTSTSRA